PILPSAPRITRTAPTPFGSAEPCCSTSDTSQRPQSFQPLRSATTAQTVSRGALECADDSTTCFAIRLCRLQPLARPRLERPHRGLERPALLGQRVLDPHRSAVEHLALDDPLALELLQPLGEQAVGEVGD